MSTTANWKTDLKYGERREGEFCERQRGWQRAETKNASYDLISADGVTAEIKSERYVTNKKLDGTYTENICVEFFNTKQNQPSGLFSEQLTATYWIHFFECGREVVFYASELREFIHETKTNYRVHHENNAANYLVPALAVKHLFLVKLEMASETKWVSQELTKQIQ